MNLIRKIRAPWTVALLAATGLLAGPAPGAPSTNEVPTTGFDTFQLVVQRNIFDPNRYPHTPRSRPRERQPGVPTFTLAGTMSYRKGMFAFFDGTSSDYRKALQDGGTIAGYTVTNINWAGAQLLSTGLVVNLRVGSGMRQEGDGWQPTSATDLAEPPAAGPADNSSTDNAAPASPASGAPPNDILKRLMQQREQEMK
ncbi:MAG TPA: hypothetical protein VFV81_07370 [Verrucomicrobiae bacterium]|nr:hypothetical protein [Verrucomicrobiae bacterium]